MREASLKNLSYCKPEGAAQVTGPHQLPCQFRDEYFAIYPSVELNSAFVTTRVTSHQETLPSGCDASTRKEPACLNWELKPKTANYIAQAEYFTVGIDHSMLTSFRREGHFFSPRKGRLTSLTSRTTADVARTEGTSSHVIGGEIRNEDDEVVEACYAYHKWGKPCPPYVNVFGNGGAPSDGMTAEGQTLDVIPLETLLYAAGVELDELSPYKHKPPQTYRNSGLVIHVAVIYSNVDPDIFDSDKFRYQYKVSLGADHYKGEEVDKAAWTDSSREIYDRHGTSTSPSFGLAVASWLI